MMCGQHDLVEQFAAGEDVYTRFASGSSPVPLKTRSRRSGSLARILGLGYGCGAPKFHNMVTMQARQNGIELEGLFDEYVAQSTVGAYRSLYHHKGTWDWLDRELQLLST